VHAAGLPQACAIGDLTPGELANLVAAKVAGARSLDLLFADDELDAFILFSSIAGVWGSAGQSAYAAANAYLDALAEARRGSGRRAPATAVAWGPWDGGGMAGDEAGREHLRRRGLKALAPETALRALGQLLGGGGHPAASGASTTVVADVDWSVFGASFVALRPSRLLAALPEAAQSGPGRAADEDSARKGAAAIEEQLAGLSAAERRRTLSLLVRAEVAAVVGFPSGDAVEPDRAFKELGFDSLTVLELRDRLTGRTGLRLPSTLMYDYPNAASLAAHLDDERSGAAAAAAPVSLLTELDRFEAALGALTLDELGAIAPDDAEQARIARRLKGLLALWDDARGAGGGEGRLADQLDEASDDDLFDLIDHKFGRG
jgi:acyl carrier protein